MPLGHHIDRGPLGLGAYCGPHTASYVFFRPEKNMMCNIAHFCTFFMRDFDQFWAQFLSVNQKHNLRCKNQAFPIKIMVDFIV